MPTFTIAQVERLITPSTRWTGTSHATCFICVFCADSYDIADALRAHLRAEHPADVVAHALKAGR